MDNPPLQPLFVRFLGQNSPENYYVAVSTTEGKECAAASVGKSCNQCGSSVVSSFETNYCLRLDAFSVTYFRSFSQEYGYSQEIAKGPVKNILLVGSTGVGKSRWANYLSSFGQKKLFLAATARMQESCTKDVFPITMEFDEENIICRLVDTPGLNEPDFENDLNHMKSILEFLISVREISMIMLCLRWDFKEDDQTTKTVKYYQKLLPSVFTNSNVVYVLTNFSQSFYTSIQEAEEEDGVTSLFLAKEEKMKRLNSLLNLEIDVLECVESVLVASKAKKVLENCRLGDFKDKVPYFTFQARRRILQLAKSSIPVPITQQDLALPPTAKKKAKAKLLEIESILGLLEQYVSQRNEESGRCWTTIRQREELIVSELRFIEALRLEELEFSSPQLTTTRFLMGESWFNLSREDCFLEFSIPVEKYEVIEINSWNCRVASHKATKQHDNTFLVRCLITPDFFTLEKKRFLDPRQNKEEEKNWFIRLRIKWDGKIYYSKEIADIKNDLIEHQSILDNLVSENEENKEQQSNLSLTVEKQEIKQSQLIQQKTFLSQKRFKISEVSKLCLILTPEEEIPENENGIEETPAIPEITGIQEEDENSEVESDSSPKPHRPTLPPSPSQSQSQIQSKRLPLQCPPAAAKRLGLVRSYTSDGSLNTLEAPNQPRLHKSASSNLLRSQTMTEETGPTRSQSVAVTRNRNGIRAQTYQPQTTPNRPGWASIPQSNSQPNSPSHSPTKSALSLSGRPLTPTPQAPPPRPLGRPAGT